MSHAPCTYLAGALLLTATITTSALADVQPGVGGGAIVGAEVGADVGSVVRFSGPTNLPDAMGGYASDRVIVRLAPGVSPIEFGGGAWALTKEVDGAMLPVMAGLEAFGVSAVERALRHEPSRPDIAARHGLDRYWIMRVPVGSPVREIATTLSQMPELVESAEADGIGGILGVTPDDPSFNVQYGLNNTGQTIQGSIGVPGADINAVAAWSLHTGSPDIVLALIDTGVSSTHPDLASKVITGYNALNGGSNTADSWIISHGTHCAGIAAAASNNGTGISGVDWGAKIMPIKVLNLIGGGLESDCANGVVWAADNGAHVASLSLGFPDGTAFFASSIAYAYDLDVVIVAATGNTPGAQIFFPARWPQVIAVGATTNQDVIASFTTTGAQMEVVAPGVDVYSTYAALFSAPYVYQSGTSMACPHVAGLATLIRGANPSLSAPEVRNIIRTTAKDLGPAGWDPTYGHGRIDAHAALVAALSVECDFADLNCDGVVDGADLTILIAAWGSDDAAADLNGDGTVDGADLGVLLANWTG